METLPTVDKTNTSCEVISVFSREVVSTNPITIIYFPGFQGELNPNFLTDNLPQAEPRISNILSIKFNTYGNDPEDYFSQIHSCIDQLGITNTRNTLVLGYSYGCKLALDFAEQFKLPCVLLSPISGYIPDMKRIAIALRNRSVNIRKVKVVKDNLPFSIKNSRKVLEQGKLRNNRNSVKVVIVIGKKDGIASIPNGIDRSKTIVGDFGHYTVLEDDKTKLVNSLLIGIEQVLGKMF